MRVIGPVELKRINVDTTVQTKAIRFRTDARLYQRILHCPQARNSQLQPA
jgi:hypothetical protein